MTHDNALVTTAPWDSLKRFTDARIALGRAGHSLPTHAHLNFQLAHAQARDAVHLPFDPKGIADVLQQMGLESIKLRSAAPDRNTYLQRPDLGRRLSAASLAELSHWAAGAQAHDARQFDLAFVIADGLSALAVHHHATDLLAATLARLQADASRPWSVAPIILVQQGRVAVGDEVGQTLRARMVVVMIGERPGLSSPDSMGLYMSWAPVVGLHDAQRNCISNVRPAGLPVAAAADKLHYLVQQAFSLGLTGIGLKDESVAAAAIGAAAQPRLAPSDIWQV